MARARDATGGEVRSLRMASRAALFHPKTMSPAIRCRSSSCSTASLQRGALCDMGENVNEERSKGWLRGFEPPTLRATIGFGAYCLRLTTVDVALLRKALRLSCALPCYAKLYPI